MEQHSSVGTAVLMALCIYLVATDVSQKSNALELRKPKANKCHLSTREPWDSSVRGPGVHSQPSAVSKARVQNATASMVLEPTHRLFVTFLLLFLLYTDKYRNREEIFRNSFSNLTVFLEYNK